MMIEHQEVARYRVAEQLRAAEARAQRQEQRGNPTAEKTSAPRRKLATALRRLADRLEPQPRHARSGLSVVR